jgi:hypothetical protein
MTIRLEASVNTFIAFLLFSIGIYCLLYLLYFSGVEESFEKIALIFFVACFVAFAVHLFSEFLKSIDDLLEFSVKSFNIVFLRVENLETEDI